MFSSEARTKFNKLMESRIRRFTPSSILKMFERFMNEKRLDNYWLENVFISLFKNHQYPYDALQIGKIFRFMMILDHEVTFL